MSEQERDYAELVVTLAEMLLSRDPVIKRHAQGILKRYQVKKEQEIV